MAKPSVCTREEEISEMRTSITQIKTDLPEIKTDLRWIKVSVEKLNSSINGNGQPGLNQRIQDLERHKSYNKGLWIALTIFISIASVAVYFLK